MVCSQKMNRVAGGRAQGTDQATIANDIKALDNDVEALNKEFKQIMSSLDQGEQKSYDEKMNYIRQKMNDLNRQHRTYMSQQYTQFTPEIINQEDATIENIQLMKEQKDQNLREVGNQVKQLKRVNQDIKQELDKGDEIIGELQGDIRVSNQNVVKVTSKTQQFAQYLKKNKAPFSLTIIMLIITVLFWSSKAFCDWGLTWQCK